MLWVFKSLSWQETKTKFIISTPWQSIFTICCSTTSFSFNHIWSPTSSFVLHVLQSAWHSAVIFQAYKSHWSSETFLLDDFSLPWGGITCLRVCLAVQWQIMNKEMMMIIMIMITMVIMVWGRCGAISAWSSWLFIVCHCFIFDHPLAVDHSLINVECHGEAYKHVPFLIFGIDSVTCRNGREIFGFCFEDTNVNWHVFTWEWLVLGLCVCGFSIDNNTQFLKNSQITGSTAIFQVV